MEKLKYILNFNKVLILLFMLFGGKAFGQVTLSLRYLSTDNKYHVYLTPTASLSAVTNAKLTDGSSQITLMSNTGGTFAIGTVTSVSPAGSWSLSTTTINSGDVVSGAPAGKDFFVITPSGDFSTINYVSGTEVELFNFDVTGTCTGSLGILPAGSQTAEGGTLNIGSYYSVKGFTGGIGTNHFASTYNMTAACPSVVVAAPDLTTTIGQPTTPLTVGVSSNIPVTITNIGTAPATGPIVTTLTLPTGTTAPLTFLSNGSSCSTLALVVTCSTPGPLSNVSPSNTAVINIPVTPSASTVGTTPTFTGTTSAPNEPVGNLTNNPATPMVPTAAVAGVPDLTTTIGQPTTPLTVGVSSNIPVTITNIGTAPATGPIVTTLTLPTGTTAPLTFLSNGSSCSTLALVVTCSTPGPLSNVSPSNTAVINIPVTPLASTVGTTPTFTGTTSAPNEPVGNLTNNPATPMVPTAAVAGVPDLTTTIGQPTTPLTVGVSSNIPVTITNIGTAPATGPIVTTLTLPTGTTAPLTFLSNGSSCSTLALVVTCSTPGPLSNVSPSNTAVINIPVTPSASTVGTTPTFTGTTSAPNEPVGNLTNNPATPMVPTAAVAGVPDLTTTIGQPTTPLTVGVSSNIPVTITNIGTAPATGPIVTTLTLPTGTTAPLTFLSNGSSCSTLALVVTCSTPGPLSNVSPSNTAVINIPVTPSASTVGTTPTFTGTTSAPNEPVGNLTNNPATPMVPTTAVIAGNTVVSVRVLLQGGYQSSGLMRDNLRTKSLIPTTQPYTALGYTHIGGGGSETVSSTILAISDVNNAIVDWVIVELRDATTPSTVIASKAALIQKDGDIVSAIDGISPVTFTGISVNNYYVAVKHRNHLGVMTKTALNFAGTVGLIDFTASSTLTNGTNSMKILSDGKLALWAGNTTGDNKVIYSGVSNDVDPIFAYIINDSANAIAKSTSFVKTAYTRNDVNLTGTVVYQGPSNEVDMIFTNILNHPTNLAAKSASFVILEQIP